MYPVDRKMHPRSLPEMTPADNVLYFPNNIDVRLCPKNAMSTLKQLYRLQFGIPEHSIGISYRQDQVSRLSSAMDKPFRKGSFRVAVRRDPIDRFKSACEYIQSMRAYFISKGKHLPELSNSIQEVIDGVQNETLKDNHFYTQSYYMGLPNDYDMVVHISELDKLLSFLKTACDLHVENVDTLHVNKSVHKLYNDALSIEQIEQLRSIYAKDFKNGWCKQEDYITV